MIFTALASPEAIKRTAAALREHGVLPIVTSGRTEALQNIKQLIPQGASVMNGASRTLEQIGFVDYLKTGTHGWSNLHAGVLAEKDKVKQVALRKQATLSDFYLGSVHALTETGEFIIASNTGSQLPHIVFSSPNLIFVVGTQKIVPTLADAMERLEKYVIPLEDKNMQVKYGTGTMLSKLVIFKRENPRLGRKVTLLLVPEVLGF